MFKYYYNIWNAICTWNYLHCEIYVQFNLFYSSLNIVYVKSSISQNKDKIWVSFFGEILSLPRQIIIFQIQLLCFWFTMCALCVWGGGGCICSPPTLYYYYWWCYLVRIKPLWDDKIDLGQQGGKSLYSKYLLSIFMFPTNIKFLCKTLPEQWFKKKKNENWVSLPLESFYCFH